MNVGSELLYRGAYVICNEFKCITKRESNVLPCDPADDVFVCPCRVALAAAQSALGGAVRACFVTAAL